MIFLARYPRNRLRKHFETVARRAVRRALKLYPQVVAIGVDGSVGRRNPQPYSDIDIFALVRSSRCPRAIHYVDMGCYVGIGFNPLKEKKRRGIDFFWARGGTRAARVLYDPKGILRKQIEKARKAIAPPSIVEETLLEAYTNIIEYAGKLRNGWLAADEYLTRYAARIIAGRSEEAVMALNDISPITENVVWQLVTKAKKRPTHFAVDYPIAMGFRGTAQTRLVFRSGLRLAQESLQLIRAEYAGKASNKSLLSLLQEPLMQVGL